MISSIKGSIAVKILIAAINFLVIVLSARWLGATGRGEIAFFITVLASVQLFTEIINGPTIVFLSTRLSARKKLVLAFLWALMISVIAWGIFEIYDYKDSFYLSACSLQLSMGMTCLMILQGYNRINLYNCLLLLQSFLFIGLFATFFFLFGKDYHYLIYSFFISWNLPFLISFFTILKNSRTGQFFSESYTETFRKMFKKGIESQSGNIISFLNYRLIFYIVAYQNVDKSFLGFVSTGFAIVESVLMIGNGLGTVQYPSISNNPDKAKAKIITLEYLAISCWLAMPALLVMNLIPASFYGALFGKDFSNIKLIILLLSPGILFLNLQSTLCYYFNGLGLYMINTIGSLTGLVSFIVLAAIAFQSGTYGLCAAVSLSYIILFGYMLYRFLQHSGASAKELFAYLGHPKKAFDHLLRKA